MARQLIKFPKALLTIENLSGLGRLIRLSGKPAVDHPVGDLNDLWDGEPVAEGAHVLVDHLLEKHPDLLIKPMGLLLSKAVNLPDSVAKWIRWDEVQAQESLSDAGKRAYRQIARYKITYGYNRPVERLLSHYNELRDIPGLKSGKKHSPCSDRIRLYFYLGQNMPNAPVWVMPGHKLTGTAMSV